MSSWLVATVGVIYFCTEIDCFIKIFYNSAVIHQKLELVYKLSKFCDTGL